MTSCALYPWRRPRRPIRTRLSGSVRFVVASGCGASSRGRGLNARGGSPFAARAAFARALRAWNAAARAAAVASNRAFATCNRRCAAASRRRRTTGHQATGRPAVAVVVVARSSAASIASASARMSGDRPSARCGVSSRLRRSHRAKARPGSSPPFRRILGDIDPDAACPARIGPRREDLARARSRDWARPPFWGLSPAAGRCAVARDGERDRGWLRLGSVASVLVVVTLIAAQLTFTSATTPRDDVVAFLDEASEVRERFVASVALFTALAFLVVPVFLALRVGLGHHGRFPLQLAFGFAILGAAFSATADATQLAVGAATLASWSDADDALRDVLAADAATQIWLGDVLTSLARLAFGLAVGAASLVMVRTGSRLWRVSGILGLVAAAGSLVGSFALAAAGLELVWVAGLAALLLWFLLTAAGLWRAGREG